MSPDEEQFGTQALAEPKPEKKETVHVHKFEECDSSVSKSESKIIRELKKQVKDLTKRNKNLAALLKKEKAKNV